jgi:phage terminase large subunit GpA-like protein
MGRTSGLARGKLPNSAEHLVAFIDVHDRLLWYCVLAWERDFTGQVVDWGTYPDQHEPYFTMRGARRTLARAHPGTGREGAITAGLHALYEHLKREWPREDGATQRVELCMIDSGWEGEIVHGFMAQAGSSIFLASKGIRLGAESVPWEDWTRKAGERVGHRWRIRTVRGRRLALIDTGYWKTFLQRRLAVARGDRQGIMLYGRQPSVHRLFADQLTAEACKTKTGMRGGKIDVWMPLPGRSDNHLLDCMVGCCAAASMAGCRIGGETVEPSRRKVYSAADFQRR